MSFKTVVATIASESIKLDSIGTVNGVEELISKEEKISTGTVKDYAKSLASQGSDGEARARMGSLPDANAGEGISAPEGTTTSAKGEEGRKDVNEMRPG
jgi:hypothetical protein